MHMKKKASLLALFLVFLMMAANLSGCGAGKENRYKNYVNSLISANYLGEENDYKKTTGADEADIEAMYLENVTRLANNLETFYGLEIASDAELAPRMVDIAKKIYKRAKYEVAPARRDNMIYYVDVTIHPINILNQANPQISAYVEDFNKKVANGDYDNYEKSAYEHEFASGLMDILEETADSIEYKPEQVVTLRIIETDDSYYIGNEDLQAIDAAIIATEVSAESSTATDAEAE